MTSQVDADLPWHPGVGAHGCSGHQLRASVPWETPQPLPLCAHAHYFLWVDQARASRRHPSCLSLPARVLMRRGQGLHSLSLVRSYFEHVVIPQAHLKACLRSAPE